MGPDRLCQNVDNYQSTPRNIQEEFISPMHCYWSLKPLTDAFLWARESTVIIFVTHATCLLRGRNCTVQYSSHQSLKLQSVNEVRKFSVPTAASANCFVRVYACVFVREKERQRDDKQCSTLIKASLMNLVTDIRLFGPNFIACSLWS